jgi:hypothetical protein
MMRVYIVHGAVANRTLNHIKIFRTGDACLNGSQLEADPAVFSNAKRVQVTPAARLRNPTEGELRRSTQPSP